MLGWILLSRCGKTPATRRFWEGMASAVPQTAKSTLALATEVRYRLWLDFFGSPLNRRIRQGEDFRFTEVELPAVSSIYLLNPVNCVP